MTKLSNRIKEHPLALYFILAYAFSWAIEIPLALQANGIIPAGYPFSLHYLSAFGPLAAAILGTAVTGGREALRELFSRFLKWRVTWMWWLAALSPLGLYLLAAGFLGILQGTRVDIQTLGQVDFLPSLGLGALPMWILTFGIGEECGWRGYALPRLQKNRSAFSATLILWGFWSLWHLPLFFYSYDPWTVPGVLIGLLAGAIIFTWLYNSTGGSILMTAIWHGAFNTATGCLSCKTGLIAAATSTMVMVWAVVVLVGCKPENLSRMRKHVL